MKLPDAIAALQLVPADRANAITVPEFVDRWKRAGQREMSDRQLQRWLPELEGLSLVESTDGERGSRRYFRTSDRTASWAMTPETALRLLVSGRMLEQPLQGLGAGGLGLLDMARSVVGTSDAMRRLHRRVRVVPDGLGRLRAAIAPGVQETVVDAIVRNRQLRFAYLSRTGMAEQGRVLTHDVSVLGLVSKDSTVYLLGAKGVSGKPLTFALHRMRDAQVLPDPAAERTDFDLDDYIAKTHQLSHTLEYIETIDLRLRVRADSVWHFTERPLCAEQQVSREPDAQGWYAVHAPVTNTTLLVPFLLSMGEVVIVDGPPEVRELLLRRVSEAHALYTQGAGAAARS